MLRRVEKFLLIFLSLLTSERVVTAQNSSVGNYSSVFLTDIGGQTYNNVVDLYQDKAGFMWISLYGGGLVRYDGSEFTTFRKDTPTSLCNNYLSGAVQDGFDRLWVGSVGGLDIIDLKTLTNSEIAEQFVPSTGGAFCSAPVCTSDGAIWYSNRNFLHRITFKMNGQIESRDSVKCSDSNFDLRLVLSEVDEDASVWTFIDGYITKIKYLDGKGFQMTNINRFLYLGEEIRANAIVRRGYEIWVGTSNGLYVIDQATGETKSYFDDKLLSNEITSIAVTADGSIAVGTLSGLNIYNPVNDTFDAYNASVSSYGYRALAGNQVRSLKAVGEDLWVGSDRDGISILRRKHLSVTDVRHRENDLRSLPDAQILSIFFDSKGRHWIGTSENGLFQREDRTFNFHGFNTRNSGLKHNSISAMTEDSRGMIWVGTLGGELDIMNPANPSAITQVPGIPEHFSLDDIYDLEYDRINDFMWVAARTGIYYYDIAKKILVKCQENVRMCTCILRDSNDNLWITHSDGLLRINMVTRELKSHPLPFFPVTLAFDTHGNFWLGGFDSGLYLYNIETSQTRQFSTSEGLIDNRVRGLLPDGEYLWISTDQGLSRMNVNSQDIRSFSSYEGIPAYSYCGNSVSLNPVSKTLLFGHKRGITLIWSGSIPPAAKRNINVSFTEGRSGKTDLSLAYSDRIDIKQKDKVFTAKFADFSFGDPQSLVFYTRLYPLEKEWTKVSGTNRSVTYAGLGGGDYKLQLKAESLSGNLLGEASKEIHVKPYFHRTVLFYILLALFVFLVWFYVDRMRTYSLKKSETELQAEVDKQTKQLYDQKLELEKRAEELLEQNRILLKQNEALAGHRMVASTDIVTSAVANKDTKFVERVMETIRGLYKDPDLDVLTFCKAIGMSRSVLNAKIQDTFGQSIAQFIRTYRLNVAKEILTNSSHGNINISEVAYEIGFSDPKYFTRCFSKEFGVSPSSVLADSETSE